MSSLVKRIVEKMIDRFEDEIDKLLFDLGPQPVETGQSGA